MTDYQFVREWNKKTGRFSSLTPEPKRPVQQHNSTFDTEAEEPPDSTQGNRTVDGSMRNSPSAGDMGRGSAAEEENEQLPSRGVDRDHVTTRKRKRASSSALAGVVAAFQEMSAGIMRIEKENSERAKEAHEMAKDAHELEKRKFEFQQRKVEREEERADKFVGVLGQIAGAFRKMAEKM